jgi:hypothetical protein
LRGCVTLVGRPAKPPHSFGEVSLDTLAHGITTSEPLLRFRMVFIGRLTQPLHGFGGVFGHAFANQVATSFLPLSKPPISPSCAPTPKSNLLAKINDPVPHLITHVYAARKFKPRQTPSKPSIKPPLPPLSEPRVLPAMRTNPTANS